jgi:hypothetical protein
MKEKDINVTNTKVYLQTVAELITTVTVSRNYCNTITFYCHKP